VIHRNKGYLLQSIEYGLYFYFLGLSLRKTAADSGIVLLYFIKRNHVSIWTWIQKYGPKNLSFTQRRIGEFIVDKTLKNWFITSMAMGCHFTTKDREILAISVSKERNMLISERFISRLVKTRTTTNFYEMGTLDIHQKHVSF
jgi:putative transposase